MTLEANVEQYDIRNKLLGLFKGSSITTTRNYLEILLFVEQGRRSIAQ
jgi:hypothetical protein